MQIEIMLGNRKTKLLCFASAVSPAEPGLGITSSYVDDFSAIDLDQEKPLTLGQYDLISERDQDYIRKALMEEVDEGFSLKVAEPFNPLNLSLLSDNQKQQKYSDKPWNQRRELPDEDDG